VGLALVPRTAPQGDAELLAGCLAGDEAAQRALFRREYPRVHATVYRVLGSARDVDDLVQDTFIAVFRALPSFRGDAKLSTWIDRIAVRVVFGHIRKRKPSVSLDAVAEVAAPVADLDERAEARDGLRRLYTVLGRLTPEARIAFVLFAIDGRTIAEVASVIGTTAVTAKLRIWRARREVERRAANDALLAQYLSTHGEEAP
jgi:RNA polymerase sigma-70 factor, ECF subfamily